MPSYRPIPQPKPIEVDKFLGLNETYGDTEVKLGEAIYMRNFNITNNYKLRKRTGFTTFLSDVVGKPIQGMWYGIIATKKVIIYATNSNVYEYDVVAQTTVLLGTITDAETEMFYFGSMLYFINGTDYKQYDGTTFQDIDAYIPTIAIGSTPSGGGTLFEEINLLTGEKAQEFIADGTSVNFVLGEDAITTLDVVKVNGVTKTLTTDYTVNLTTGVVTFIVAPTNEALVEIVWTKSTTGHSDLVKKNKCQMLFGAGNDTNIFLWGNPDQKNRLSYSATSDPTYFPVNNFTLIGSNEFAITDVVGQYSRQIIFKEDRTYYSYAEYNSTLNTYIYPIFDLNESVGNITMNGAQVVDNKPYTLKNGAVWKWTNTAVEDERNVDAVSERVRKSLSLLDLSTALTFDNQIEKEYWLHVGGKVFIHNYGNDTWYVYDGISATCFMEISGVMHFGTADGKIQRFDSALNDNGVAINATWKSGFVDFNTYEYEKNSRNMWFSIQPFDRTSASVKCPTNKKNEDDLTIKTFKKDFVFFNLDDIDFEDFSFQTNRNPQTFHIKIKAKNYTSIQFIVFNNEIDEELVFLSFKVSVELGNII